MTQLDNVNTRDLVDAIKTACGTMCSVFDADDNNRPFFLSQVLPTAKLSFHWAHSEAHVPGRHLNALLNAAAATDVAISDECIENHAQAVYYSYSGPVALPLNRAETDGPLVNFIPHNIREGFHALYALVAYRQSARAQALAEASIAAINQLWDADRGWDYGVLEDDLGLVVQRSTFVVGLARAIGPLVKYYRATGYGPALDLALRLKEKAIAEFFVPDGGYDSELFGPHTHSTTCVMSGLAQLADVTHDAALLEHVRAFYDNGLWEIRDALGWVLEFVSDTANPDRGECNNTGDVVETALILAKWGHTRLYEDAERIVRGHLLPAQLRDISFITDPPNPDGVDGLRDVAARHRGAFGFPAPYGHLPLDQKTMEFNLDIVGGATGSLCEVVRESVRSDAAGHWVTMFFDRSTPSVDVCSPYDEQRLQVRVKRPGALWLRIPSWIDKERVLAEAKEQAGPAGASIIGEYVFVPAPPRNAWLSFDWPLAESTLVLRHRTREMRARLLGDETVAMDNHGAEYTFFPPYE